MSNQKLKAVKQQTLISCFAKKPTKQEDAAKAVAPRGNNSENVSPGGTCATATALDRAKHHQQHVGSVGKGAASKHQRQSPQDQATDKKLRACTTANQAVNKQSAVATEVDAHGNSGLAARYAQDVLGRRVRVLWPDDDIMYSGTLGRYNSSTGQHRVDYDDGDQEWIRLAEEVFEFEGGSTEGGSAGGPTAAAARKPRRVLLSDDEEAGDLGAAMNSDSEEEGSDWETEAVQAGVVGGSASKDDNDDDDDDDDDGDDDEGLDVPLDARKATLKTQQAQPKVASSPGYGNAEGWDRPLATRMKQLKTQNSKLNTPAAGKRKALPHSATHTNKRPLSDATVTPLPATTFAKSTPSSCLGGDSAYGAKAHVAPWTMPGKLGHGPRGTLTPGVALGHAAGPHSAPSGVAKTSRFAPKEGAAVRAGGSTLDGGHTRAALSGRDAEKGDLREAMSVGEERWAARIAEKFSFLLPDRIRDAAGRRPDDPDYNPTTLHIPKDFYKKHKITDGQQQWWEFKAANFDSILLFKVGKFYEIFEMDSHVGVDVLGLQYMKGEQPHCGFPEANYHHMAETLARAGHRVVVVEQTETPDMLKKRNEELKAQGKPKASVVRREIVAVLTQGTLTDAEMLKSQPDAAYLMALVERDVPKAAAGVVGQAWLGVCAVDCATGQMLFGQWYDDSLRSRLRAQLAALQPVEIVYSKGGLSSECTSVLKACLQSPRTNELLAEDAWDVEQTVRELELAAYFGTACEPGNEWQQWPHNLKVLLDGTLDNRPAIEALGCCVSYLRSVLLDQRVVTMGRIELLAGCAAVEGAVLGAEHMRQVEGAVEYVTLDGSALDNLEVLCNSDGGRDGSLLAVVDHCVTPSGRRMLKEWLTRPLAQVKDIVARQEAVADLMGSAAEAVGHARKTLSGMADLERSLARLSATASGVGAGRDADHVVLYEDTVGRKVAAFIDAMEGLQTLQQAVECFSGVLDSMSSSLLRNLVSPGRLFPDMHAPMNALLGAADWQAARKSSRIIPTRGVDEQYDAAVDSTTKAEGKLQQYLIEVRKQLHGGRDVAYVSLNKESHVIEVPQALEKHVPRDFELVGQRKGFKRYMTVQLRRLVQQLGDAQEDKEKAMKGILQGLVCRFVRHGALWTAAVHAVAQLDVLGSLAIAASMADGPMCTPRFVGGSPSFRATCLRHPAAVCSAASTFVPNDVHMGGQHGNFLLLTGPNMGGKSTLLRQVCQAALLAHIGACVPAASLEMTPVDAIFVRMGARDHIVAGHSTFFVELSETSMMLNRATARSLVALDELGRGTATTDGAAIAAAVLQHLAQKVQCRGLFATHYHRLADMHSSDPHVAVKHMACAVEQQQDGSEAVTFLYKLTDNACPKSYGTNVARLAGLPEQVVQRAAEFASLLERQNQHGGAGTAGLVAADTSLPGVEAARQLLPVVNDGTAADAKRYQQLLNIWRIVRGMPRGSYAAMASC